MPLDYTNTIYDKIMESLASIINAEFNIPVYYDEHRGNQSFLFIPAADSLVSHLQSGIEREYTIEIEYELKTGGAYNKNDLKQVSNIMERLKRLVFNNMSYDNGDTWFDAGLENIEYLRDEDGKNVLKSIATFNCTNIEII